MTPFWLDDVLSSLAGPSRSNHFMTYLLETPLPGVHVDERIPEAPTSTQIYRPALLVDGAPEAPLPPGYQRNLEDAGSFNATTNILAQDGLYWLWRGSGPDSPMHEEGHVAVIHSECLKYLSENGPTFMIGSVQTKEITSAALLNMAEHVKVLSPGDDPIPGDLLLNMCRWRSSLCALIHEMRTVDERFPSLGCSSGVYVLTSSSYAAFLRALAFEIADRPSASRFLPPA